MSVAQSSRLRHVRRAFAVLVAVLALPALAGAAPQAAPARVPLHSDWIGARNGWAWIDDGGQVRATTDGGRTWETIFSGSNYLLYPYARTSRNAAVVATGRIAGEAFWTNDGGRNWFPLDAIPIGATAAGSGNGLFWHDRRDTLHRVEGWPPRGDFACDEVTPDYGGPPLPGHKFCRAVDDGLRSVVVARIPGGTFDPYGGMVSVPPARGLPGGVVELVSDLPHPRGGAPYRGVVVVRGGGISLARQLPHPALGQGEETGGEKLLASWPRLYVIAPLMKAAREPDAGPKRIGDVLLRSRDGGDRWAGFVARSLPRRAAHVRGPAQLGTRVVLPGGWVAAGRAKTRPIFAIRQHGRTRPLLALPGSARCGALEAVVDWPHIVVEGRRGGRTRALWLSSDGGYRWSAFGRC